MKRRSSWVGSVKTQAIVRRGRPRANAAARAVVNKIRGEAPARKRRKMSAKARAAISAAQKKRWAKVKAEKK